VQNRLEEILGEVAVALLTAAFGAFLLWSAWGLLRALVRP